MKVIEKIEKEAIQFTMLDRTFGPTAFVRGKSFEIGAKFGNNLAIENAIEILSQHGDKLLHREYVIDLMKTLRV